MNTRRLITLALCVVAGAAAADMDATQLVAAARSQIGVTVGYDPSYRELTYPGGDVPRETGVCCDVVVRALREVGLDLQQLLHEDMLDHFDSYPQFWGLQAPDANIDHRRVPNLACYFGRQAWSVAASYDAAEYWPGDIVTWDLGGGQNHIGIVSDRRTADGTPLILHNVRCGTQEEDILFKLAIAGHYRPKTAASHASEVAASKRAELQR